MRGVSLLPCTCQHLRAPLLFWKSWHPDADSPTYTGDCSESYNCSSATADHVIPAASLFMCYKNEIRAKLGQQRVASPRVGVTNEPCASCHSQNPQGPRNTTFAEIQTCSATTWKEPSISICSTSTSISKLSCYPTLCIKTLSNSGLATREVKKNLNAYSAEYSIKYLISDDTFLKNLNRTTIKNLFFLRTFHMEN